MYSAVLKQLDRVPNKTGFAGDARQPIQLPAKSYGVQLTSSQTPAYRELGQAYIQKGMYEDAVAELHKGLSVGKGHPRLSGLLGYAHAMAGQRAEAQKVLEELKDPAKYRFGSAFAIARIHAARAEKDPAFEWLQKACDERDSLVIWLKVDPMLDSLRSDPRFDARLQMMRLAKRVAGEA